VVAKCRERLVANKQRLHRFNLERINLNRVEVSNRFAAWEDLVAEVEIDSASETIRENTL
jgi:hypothetical protein